MSASTVSLGSASGTPGPAARNLDVLHELHAIQQQLAVFQEQLKTLQQQQAGLSERLNLVLQGWPGAEGAERNSSARVLPADQTVASCAQDIRRVLQEVGHPLTLLEILDELVHRHLSWRENVVRHALDELLDHGKLLDTGHLRPHSYGLPANA